MKKRNLKSLSLNRKTVSNFKVTTLQGGFVSRECSDIWYQDEEGYYVCCTFGHC